jgi:adenylate cyclase
MTQTTGSTPPGERRPRKHRYSGGSGGEADSELNESELRQGGPTYMSETDSDQTDSDQTDNDQLPKRGDPAHVRGLVDHAKATGQEVASRLVLAVSGPDHESAGRGTIGTAPTARGVEPPGEIAETITPLERAFAFVDLCGFTKFIANHGEHAAVDAIARFRSLVRELSARRGVRVAKWLGDGAMIIGVEVGPTIATAAEVIGRYDARTLGLRGGVAHGRVIMIDGDDYIGHPTNLAARLCQAADPGELLAVGYAADALPPWVQVLSTRKVNLPGIGRMNGVQRLTLVPGLDLPTLAPPG